MISSWSGIPDVLGAMGRFSAQMDAGSRANVNEATAYLIKEAQANFSGSHKRGEPHQGGPLPNIVTGNLRRSILSQGIRHTGPGSYSNTVGPTAVYGRRVELGKGGRGAYPYFGPAAAATRAQIEVIATKNWAKYMAL